MKSENDLRKHEEALRKSDELKYANRERKFPEILVEHDGFSWKLLAPIDYDRFDQLKRFNKDCRVCIERVSDGFRKIIAIDYLESSEDKELRKKRKRGK